MPADRNGVVDVKPTLGLTSCEGVIPVSRHFDVVGTWGHTVEYAAVASGAICSGSIRASPGPYVACVPGGESPHRGQIRPSLETSLEEGGPQ